jgi:RNA polymerase sigma-70 factor, ECF subfamily
MAEHAKVAYHSSGTRHACPIRIEVLGMHERVANDAELMANVGRGHMSSLGELVTRHQDKVLALAYRILSRWDLAEDVAQDAFLQVARAAERYEPTAKFTTWLYRIAVNLCIDIKRRRRRMPAELGDAAASLRAVSHDDPIEVREQAEQVRRAVASLSERQRVAVVLHRFEGLSHGQIGEVTGWTTSAVESLLVRAYANLRRELADLRD